MIRTVIIDDEPGAIENIRLLLKKHNDISLMAEAFTVNEGLNAIMQHQPALIFLDVKMPRKSGFDLLDELIEKGIRDIDVIFMTAYDEFAIEAIRYAAFDYLLKPIDKTALDKSLDRFRQKTSNSTNEKARTLKTFIDTKEKLSFYGLKGVVLFFKPEDILWVEADKAYSRLWLSDGSMHVISKNLGQIENYLSDYGFVRIHKSCIINKMHICRLNRAKHNVVLKGENGEIEVQMAKRFNVKNL